MDKKRLELHSTASHGPAYFFDVIKQAKWLLKETRSGNVVDVYFHPMVVRSPLAILGILNIRKISRKFTRKISLIKDYLSSPTSNSGKKKIKNISSTLSVSVYKKVFFLGISCFIKTLHGDIHIVALPKKIMLSLRSSISNDWTAINLWLGIFVAGRVNAERLLNLTYDDILIGDLIASTALRKYPKAGGDLHECVGFLELIARSVAIVNYCRNNLLARDLSVVYVTVPELTYLHAIYKRTLRSDGANVLESHDYTGRYQIIKAEEAYANPKIARGPGIQSLVSNQREKAFTYLNSRIEKPGENLWYMYHGANRIDDRMLDSQGNEIDVSKNSLYAVIFLHSFDDGQYLFGLDGFDGIYHWTIESIDACLANRNIKAVFLKSHPSADNIRNPGNKVAVERIAERYKSTDRLVWLKKDTSPKAFVDLGKFVGITHHGSVAEELTFLGVPVVTGIYAPWGKIFKFTYSWSSPSQYRDLLRSISVDSWARPSDWTQDELYRFVLEYRINITPIEEHSAWMIFARLIDGKWPTWHARNLSYYEDYLDELPDNSETFFNFVKNL